MLGGKWHRTDHCSALLLDFDFTGSCERATDSNGYSLRIRGTDYGLEYLLRIVQRNGELVLVGTPRNPRQSEVIVGRTKGLGTGLIQIYPSMAGALLNAV